MSLTSPLSASSQIGLPPGTIIANKYRVDGVLGSGGMGVVLSATHLDLEAPVAIKIVREELAENEEVVARLLFEAKAAARMRSAHIVRVLDVARLDNGVPYIVMEQLQGADLSTLLAERGALSVAEAVGYLLQACEGLAEAHSVGIIHRDLKPENLFLANTPEGVVLKILDFGISKDMGTPATRGSRATLSRTGSAVGSPYYMSPEQMRASPDLDARADIWSLGAILFELLTGRCPFEEETPALLCAKVMVEEAPSLREVVSSAPETLDAIVRRCLEKDVNARFQTVIELAIALRAFAAEQQPAAGDPARLASGIDLKTTASPLALELPPPQRDRAASPSRKGTLFALLGVSTLLILAGAAFWRLQVDPERVPWLNVSRSGERHDAASRAPATAASQNSGLTPQPIEDSAYSVHSPSLPASALPPKATASVAPGALRRNWPPVPVRPRVSAPTRVSEPSNSPQVTVLEQPLQAPEAVPPAPPPSPAPAPAVESDSTATRYGL